MPDFFPRGCTFYTPHEQTLVTSYDTKTGLQSVIVGAPQPVTAVKCSGTCITNYSKDSSQIYLSDTDVHRRLLPQRLTIARRMLCRLLCCEQVQALHFLQLRRRRWISMDFPLNFLSRFCMHA